MDPPKPIETQTSSQTPKQSQDPNPNPAGDAQNGEKNWASFVMESSEPQPEPVTSPTPKKSVHWSPELVSQSVSNNTTSMSDSNQGSNTYAGQSPALTPSFSFKDSVETVRNVFGRWRKSVGEASKKAEDLAGNTWQHLKTSPSFADAAMGRIAQGTKVIAEGGYERIFRSTFETVPEEQLQNSFACYLSTSAGPVMGVLYVSSAKIAYCSDNPISYKAENQTEWSYYKVVIPLHQLKAVNPSSSRSNPAEKYIQVLSVDNHEFWFMGFLNYDAAVQCLQGALQARSLSV
ncbi:hypothetical protein M0R45_004955 [Rubus argutus]|uniref:GRAM domain-containing protein n=1 Tax=Rubus argutus TaxID=59490 RepID=A0AAW1YLB7_RUBAR